MTTGSTSPAKPSSRAATLWLGLLGAPLAWIAQMGLSQVLSSSACYGAEGPAAEPAWPSLPVAIGAISLLCIGLGILSTAGAASEWHRVRTTEASVTNEAARGRMRFLAMLATLSSLLFLIAIIFTSCAALFVSPCTPWFP